MPLDNSATFYHGDLKQTQNARFYDGFLGSFGPEWIITIEEETETTLTEITYYLRTMEDKLNDDTEFYIYKEERQTWINTEGTNL